MQKIDTVRNVKFKVRVKVIGRIRIMVTVGAIDDVYVCDVKKVLVLVLAILFTSIVNNPASSGCMYLPSCILLLYVCLEIHSRRTLHLQRHSLTLLHRSGSDGQQTDVAVVT